MTKTAEDRQRENARKRAEHAANKLRRVAEDARADAMAFSNYVDSWAEGLADGTLDPRSFTEGYVAKRALEQLEGSAYIHTGSTRHMNYRAARDAVIDLATADLDEAPGMLL